jgi:hypothetical protein
VGSSAAPTAAFSMRRHLGPGGQPFRARPVPISPSPVKKGLAYLDGGLFLRMHPVNSGQGGFKTNGFQSIVSTIRKRALPAIIFA